MAIHLLDPPDQSDFARFDSAFGQRVLLTVDTEEEFDWNGGFDAHDYRLDAVPKLERFQQFAEGIGVVPVYLIDWPVAHATRAQEVLRDAAARGAAEIGVQLHPWVNPPHLEETDERNSFAGNLPAELERDKLYRLREAIEAHFGVAPQVYRAGRYGAGANTAATLKECGIGVDSSVRAFYDYSSRGGPNYAAMPNVPYWVDGALLELPLTTVFGGMLRRQGAALYPWLARHSRLRSVAARSGLLERIPLTPEGIAIEDALRGIDIALDDGLPVLVLSFHSPSLAVGHTPYVNTDRELDGLYDWFRAVYAHLEKRDVAPTTIGEIMRAVAV